MLDKKIIQNACFESEAEMTEFLDRLLRFESISGYEGPAMSWLHDQFKDIADICEKIPVPEDIVNDHEYSSKVDKQPYGDRPNVRVVLKGNGSGKSVIFNAHADVVPPTPKQEHPFDPYIKDGAIYGRGACDDKGQIAALWTMMKVMKKLGIRPKGDIILHLVIEEEPGGNGTLALVRRGEIADFCIDLEPLSNTICPSVRGAIWFDGTCSGIAGHSGTAHVTVSALKMAIEVIRIIEEYHDELLAQTINDDPLYAPMKNPMPVNFGELHSGNWPTIAPEKATFSGMFGFLTTPKETVMQELVNRIKTRGPEWLDDNFQLTFPYRHDTSRISPDLPFVKQVTECYKNMGIERKLAGSITSMDAWLYTHFLGIPTLATGVGNLEDAHTIHEHVKLRDVVLEAAVLIMFILTL
ncbi:MAG: M20/M25/M40 family metallo-hydrolase [Candidatus Latescibacteria bacterium]|nr:M20/M25/M40 family metallo-hydrolase [Candidatus Latescibacterota bacterium]